MNILLLFFIILSTATAALPDLTLQDFKNQDKHWQWSKSKQGTVVVFLSSICPCSNAHVGYLKSLREEYPNYTFLGIHSNADEKVPEASTYFSSLDFNFPILKDHQSKWANELKAYRTPHAFLIDQKGEILYQGGVTSSSDPKRAEHLYLKEALTLHQKGATIQSSRTRVLGCEIERN